MFPPGGRWPLNYRRIGRAELGAIGGIDFDPDQIERFFDPLADIIAAVRRGMAHTLFAIEAEQKMIGFYALHPDRHDADCWWLGWFALDRHQQGRGIGRRVLARIMAGFRRIPRCRRVRLLVTPDNAHAIRLYGSAGFRRVGANATGDLILEAALPALPRRANAAATTRRPSSLARRAHLGCRPQIWPVAHEVREIAIGRGPPSA